MLLGRNGAGKTTTLRTIMGLWRASRGEIRLGGERIEALATPDIARAGIGYVPETMAVFSDLTVRENLVLAAREGAMDEARLDWIFGFFPPLKKFWLSRAGTLSGGQKQMLSFARAFIEERKLLLIDEPTKGLAPAIIGALIDCLKEVKRRGATILLVEQNFRVAQEIGDTGRRDGQWPRRSHRHDGGARRRCRRCSTGCSASAWIRTNERRQRQPTPAPRCRRRAAIFCRCCFRVALALAALPFISVALDLGDADHRGARDGHDDLHHGVGPDADLRPDGRAQFRPRRLHRDRRLYGDRWCWCRSAAGCRPTRSGSTSRRSCRRCCSRWRSTARARPRVRARRDRAGLRPAPEADPHHHGRHDRRRADPLRVLRPAADSAAAAREPARLVPDRRGGDREISRRLRAGRPRGVRSRCC